MYLIKRLKKQYQSTVILSTEIINKTSEFYIYSLNKTFGSLLEISPTNSIFLKTFNSKFSYIEEWFTDQNSQPLELEDKKS